MPKIHPRINAEEIEHELKSINEAETEDNNGLVAYIKDGKLTFDTYANLFNTTSFDEDT